MADEDNYIVDESLISDARTINEILPDYSCTVAFLALGKYKGVPSHVRIQNVLHDYFAAAVKRVPQETLYQESLRIIKIFPKTPHFKVLHLLKYFADSENRVKEVVRHLLSAEKQVLKRPMLPSEKSVIKKPKIVGEVNQPSVSTSVPINTHNLVTMPDVYVNKPSTSMCGPLDAHSLVAPPNVCVTDIVCCSTGAHNLVTTPQIYVKSSIFSSARKYVIIPSTSVGAPLVDTSNTSLDHTIVEVPASNGVADTETPQISTESASSVADESVPLDEIDSQATIIATPINSAPSSLEDNAFAFPKAIGNDELPPSPTQQPSTSKASEPEGYNLLVHLQEMFSSIPASHIAKVCNFYTTDKYTKPAEPLFSSIINHLLKMETGFSSDEDSHNEDNLDDMDRDTNVSAIPNHTNIIEAINSVGKGGIPKNFVIPSPNITNTCGNLVTKCHIPSVVVHENTEDQSEDSKVDKTILYRLMEMFPEACPKYIRKICRGKQNHPGVLDELITVILECDYPRRKTATSPKNIVSAEEQLEMMKQIVPDADPSYLQIHCERLHEQPDALKAFVDNMVENRNYPTLKDYLRNQQLSAQQRQYTTDFSVQKFLEIIPDPKAHFNDPNRKAAKVGVGGCHYVLCFLRNHFPKIHLTKIKEVLKKNDYNLLAACRALKKLPSSMLMKSRRAIYVTNESILNIPLLQEIAYIEHYDEIVTHIEQQQLTEKREQEYAKENSLLQTCSCCFDDEIMQKNIYTCDSGCIFCKDCVKRSVEVTFGDGKLQFSCLADCSGQFSLQTLQAVLNPKMFSLIALKKQVEEVKAAGIEDLEVCPFCDFATIPARDDKLFRCLNPECMKESCRLCKETSHVPLRCEEVEKEADVKHRTYIEDKMTEALIRKCYKCGMKFIKEEGCNKMTCSCGAMMCYVCGKPVTDYKHFNGNGGDQYHLCPLYSDTNKLHEQAVLESANQAKRDIGADTDHTKLKNDPTAGIQQYYKEQAKREPATFNMAEIQNARINRLVIALQNVQNRRHGQAPQPHGNHHHHQHHHHHHHQ